MNNKIETISEAIVYYVLYVLAFGILGGCAMYGLFLILMGL